MLTEEPDEQPDDVDEPGLTHSISRLKKKGSTQSVEDVGDRFGQTCMKGYVVRNGPPKRALNVFLEWLASINLKMTLAMSLLIILVWSLVNSGLARALHCGDSLGFARLIFAGVEQMAGGSPDYLRNGSLEEAPIQCVALATVAQCMALLVQTLILAVIAVKLLTPQVELKFSYVLRGISRDDVKMLAFRVAHPDGHLVTDVQCNITWLRPATSKEGEKYMKRDNLEIDSPPLLIYDPLIVKHVITDASPMYPYLMEAGDRVQDLQQLPGSLLVTVSGVDATFGCSISGIHLFPLENVLCGCEWEDVIECSMMAATQRGTKACVDFSNWNAIKKN